MVRPRFDLGPISKTLNLSILQFIERSRFQNRASQSTNTKTHSNSTILYIRLTSENRPF